MPRTLTAFRLLALLLLGPLWRTPPLLAQTPLCTDEIILNSYQETVKAARVRIKNGFSVAGTKTFTGEVCAGVIVPPDEPCALTVSEGMRTQPNKAIVLTAAFACNVAGKAYRFDGANDYVGMDGVYPATVADNFTWEAWVNPANTHQVDGESASGTKRAKVPGVPFGRLAVGSRARRNGHFGRHQRGKRL